MNYSSALFTDFYELTMTQGYFLKKHNPRVVFDMFFRALPFDGGYAVFAGLESFLENLAAFRFSKEDIAYLRKRGGFDPAFLDYLSGFSFQGDIYSMREGTAAFPGEPMLRVEGSLIETQLIEGMLLNHINFQTLIATKTSRMLQASQQGSIMEFGLRRAQGRDGAMSASRAAFIGGASATSNTLAGAFFDIPVSGTMAHSWVMSFDSELEAFREFADIYAENPVLLIDTYDTLGSGIENAVRVGLELKKKGRNFGVRLDSGDLCYLSKKVRQKLDEAGLGKAFIVVSNDLDEYIIAQLISEGAPIDAWGVGTRMVTGGNDSSLTGVYKLSAREQGDSLIPVMKISNNPVKSSLPGIKQIYRFRDSSGQLIRDLIALADEEIPQTGPLEFFHPMMEKKSYILEEFAGYEPLLISFVKEGKRIEAAESLRDMQERCRKQLLSLDETYKRALNPHDYKISLSGDLRRLKSRLVEESSH